MTWQQFMEGVPVLIAGVLGIFGGWSIGQVWPNNCPVCEAVDNFKNKKK